jgi:AraC-like DNA-binding protein
VPQLPEIDSAHRSLLGAGVRLRRLRLDDAVDVWVMRFQNTRGLRRRALADRFEIGIQLEGRLFQRTHRSGGLLFERGSVHVVAAGETYDCAYEAGDEAARIVWFSVDASVLDAARDSDREVGILARAQERCPELHELAELLTLRESVDERLAGDVRRGVRRYLARRGELSGPAPATAARRELEREFTSDRYLGQIADSVGLRPVTLIRQFSRHYGTTPIQYRIKRRLNFADRLLWAQPELSATEVATEAGFESVSHFYRAYTAYLGTTPALRRRVFSPGLRESSFRFG